MITTEHIKKYNLIRKTYDKSVICHAPFTNLNFEQNGNITACCFNRVEVLGKYPNDTIEAAWYGEAADDLRKKIRSGDLSGGCKLCGHLIESGNYNGTKSIYYDEYAAVQPKNLLRSLLNIPPKYLPKVFEFEISNTCNLACGMCSGYFSSTIRQKREKLPALHQPYDDNFVDQVSKFLPGITDLKFLGGEPFMIDLYLKIWERVITINPKIRIHITTNGTVLNSRIKTLLKDLNAGIVLSLDSIDAANYETIRVGAKLDKVIENFYYFKSLAKQKNTYVSITSCLMTSNWKDIPALVLFANREDVSLHFNIVWNPGNLSLRYLDHDRLEEIEQFFESQTFETSTEKQRKNVSNFKELIGTIRHWKKERSFTKLNNHSTLENSSIISYDKIDQILSADIETAKMCSAFLWHYAENRNGEKERMARLFADAHVEYDTLQKFLFDRWTVWGDIKFTKTFFTSIKLIYVMIAIEDKDTNERFDENSNKLRSFLLEYKNLQAVISDIIDDLYLKGIFYQIGLIEHNSAEDLINHIYENY